MNPKNGRTKTWRFEILRYDAASAAPPQFQAYELAVDRQTSVLEALWKIQDEQDPSLAFRYSCRGAVCGSCGMSINGKLNLACRVQLQALPAGRVVLEPLPGFEVLKDLVVDMGPFWDEVRAHPALAARGDFRGRGEPDDRGPERERIDQYIQCILCGLCYSACPAVRVRSRLHRSGGAGETAPLSGRCPGPPRQRDAFSRRTRRRASGGAARS